MRSDGKLVPHDVGEVGALPARLGQERMRPPQGLQAPAERLHEFARAVGRAQGLSGDRLDRRERVLDPVIELVQQELFLSRNLRQVADALAKGKLAVTIGLGRTEYEPFLNAGLPIKEVPTPKEGLPASSGYGVLGIVKNPPHPNAMKVFVNWFLGKEGQEFYAKVMKQGTRRLDVDTKWMSQIGVNAAKDVMTLADYHKLRNHLEDKVIKVRRPAAEFAEKILGK